MVITPTLDIFSKLLGFEKTFQQIFLVLQNIFDIIADIFSDLLSVGVAVFATTRSFGYFLAHAMPAALAYVFLLFLTLNIVFRIVGRE